MNGIDRFEHFNAVVHVCFPEGKARCVNCKYYIEKIRRCGLTYEVCVEPEKYRHWECPLIPEEEIFPIEEDGKNE